MPWGGKIKNYKTLTLIRYVGIKYVGRILKYVLCMYKTHMLYSRSAQGCNFNEKTGDAEAPLFFSNYLIVMHNDYQNINWH